MFHWVALGIQTRFNYADWQCYCCIHNAYIENEEIGENGGGEGSIQVDLFSHSTCHEMQASFAGHLVLNTKYNEEEGRNEIENEFKIMIKYVFLRGVYYMVYIIVLVWKERCKIASCIPLRYIHNTNQVKVISYKTVEVKVG